MKEIRNHLTELSKPLAGQKAGLSRWKTEADKEWYRYAINFLSYNSWIISVPWFR